LINKIAVDSLIEQVAAVAVHGFGDGVQRCDFFLFDAETDRKLVLHNTQYYLG
jgi:hypothetical protein